MPSRRGTAAAILQKQLGRQPAERGRHAQRFPTYETPSNPLGDFRHAHPTRSNNRAPDVLAPLYRVASAACGMGRPMNNSPYVPRRGERVRVTWVCPADLNPAVEVGDEFEVAFASLSTNCAELGIPPGVWVLVRRMGDTPGVSTWCHVAPLPPLDWKPPSERPTLPPGDDSGVKAFESSVASEGEWRARLHNVARLAFPCDGGPDSFPGTDEGSHYMSNKQGLGSDAE